MVDMEDYFNPRKTGGGGEIAPPDTNFNFLTWKRTSKTLKLLDFLNFILTDPMVPTLAYVFILGWVSGTVLRGTY